MFENKKSKETAHFFIKLIFFLPNTYSVSKNTKSKKSNKSKKIMSVFVSLYNYFTNLFTSVEPEEHYAVDVWHGGNQHIDEFYEMGKGGEIDYSKKVEMRLEIPKSGTILDVKKELINHIKYLENTNSVLRLAAFGKNLKNNEPLTGLVENEKLTLFIIIPNW